MGKKILIILLILIILGLIYYLGFYQRETLSGEGEPLGLVNPAALYCQEQNGALKIKTFESGEKGFCLFADGSQCEEWDFFRKNCQKGQLRIDILKEGEGKLADWGDTVLVHYTGTLENGMEFDSSLERELPFSFVLGKGQVIAGWEQGILGMRIREKRKLTIAPELAYGEAGIPNFIPAKAILIFEVEMLGIQ